MPAITVQSLQMTEDQKAELAQKIAKAVSEVTSVPEEMIYIFFQGYPLDSAAKGGKLFSKNPPKFGKGEFSK